MTASVFLTGLGVGLGLILAIGAQNAFVLRQGLRGEHVLAVVMACAVSDSLLVTLGVTSFARIVTVLPWLDPVMRYAGAAFLGWYGWRAARSAWRATEALVVAGQAPPAPLGRVLATCLALTWLNPHVYLDTVVLLGTIATRFPGAQFSFAAGAVTGSFLFFFSLGYGARLLRPLFASPAAWRVLDASVALVMWAIAVKLVIAG